MPRTTVLQVDDDPDWIRIIKDAFQGASIDLIQVTSLDEAKNTVDGVDVIICDGSIHEQYDGHNWAKELHEAGMKVIVLSAGQSYPEVPSVDKRGWTNGGKEKLVEFVQSQG
jgi:DNA-binding NtrC family response regulator